MTARAVVRRATSAIASDAVRDAASGSRRRDLVGV